VSQYATPADLVLYAINPLAFVNIPLVSQTAACIAAASISDGYTGSRYPLPYSPPYPIALVMHNAYIAVWLLMKARGINPEAGSDTWIEENYYAATENPKTNPPTPGWLARIRRQSEDISSLNYVMPTAPLFSMPAVRTGGPTAAAIRGWTDNSRWGNGGRGCW
jgi:hypothetical protein